MLFCKSGHCSKYLLAKKGLITNKKNIEIFILLDRNEQLIASEIVERFIKK
jgi:hypothetical protein